MVSLLGMSFGCRTYKVQKGKKPRIRHTQRERRPEGSVLSGGKTRQVGRNCIIS